MAKRKRLTPAALTGADPFAQAAPRRAPIADLSGAAAAQAALEEVSDVLRDARAEGRLITALPLAQVDATHLVRDRAYVDPEEMQVLIDSLKARGQQTAIEVVALDTGDYGLISGWRRLMALRQLHEETQEPRFATVKALIRSRQSAPEAYQAMVEENEVRADLSFYERARIAVQAAVQGVYPDTQTAVQALFAAARAPKRSKIMSFTVLVGALDGQLRFPEAIPEKLGLSLVAKLQDDPRFLRQLTEMLRKADRDSAAAERRVLERALTRAGAPAQTQAKAERIAEGLELKVARSRIQIAGEAVDDALAQALRQWLVAHIGKEKQDSSKG